MKSYLKISKIVLLSISLLVVIISVFLSRNDIWVEDLFYSLTIFNMFIVIDIMYYELNFINLNSSRHVAFCLFPISRFRVLALEIKYYLRRWEVFIYLLAILFYIGYFYLHNNVHILSLIPILFLYILQFFYTICFVFISKSLLTNRNYKIKIRNTTSIFISITIILVVFADKSTLAKQMFYLNPLTCGFLSYLVSENLALYEFIEILLLTSFVGLIMNKKYKEWPL